MLNIALNSPLQNNAFLICQRFQTFLLWMQWASHTYCLTSWFQARCITHRSHSVCIKTLQLLDKKAQSHYNYDICTKQSHLTWKTSHSMILDGNIRISVPLHLALSLYRKSAVMTSQAPPCEGMSLSYRRKAPLVSHPWSLYHLTYILSTNWRFYLSRVHTIQRTELWRSICL